MLSMPVLKLTCFIAVKDQVTGVAPVVITKCPTVGTGLQKIKIEVLILCLGGLEREKPGNLGLILHPYSLFCPFPFLRTREPLGMLYKILNLTISTR